MLCINLIKITEHIFYKICSVVDSLDQVLPESARTSNLFYFDYKL